MLRQFFSSLSTSRAIRAAAEHRALGLRVSRRFVAGTTMDDAVAAARALAAQGLTVTVDHLGENVTNRDEARASAGTYHDLLDAIHTSGLPAHVSCKLTHLGFDVDSELCHEMVRGLAEHAARLHGFVRVDMEGSAYTDRTLRLVREIHAGLDRRDAIGTVIQAYLRRSRADLEQLCAAGIRVRLVKGAYQEPAEVAYPAKADVDASFVALMRRLLQSGGYHAIATHDERMIATTMEFARAERVPAEAFEFQMLYGIRRDLQQMLVRAGWRMRVYLPFGAEWYPYFMRRLAERPANVWFIAKNLLRK
jgi:proline dehydrogenase